MKARKLGIIFLLISILVVNANFIAAADQDTNLTLPEDVSKNEITAIQVVGNKHISDEKILEQIETEVGDNIVHEQLRKDMRAIFDLGYFFDIRVNFKHHENGVMLIFEVIENPILSKVKVSGNSEVSSAKIKELLGVDTGKILDVNKLNKGVEEVNKYYQDEGYILAKVVNVSIKNQDELHLDIEEGKLNKIIITGNKTTKDYVIRRELKMKPGQVFNVSQMRRDLRKVYNLGYFKDIKPNLKRVEGEPQLVNLEIEVTEDKTGTFTIGGGWNSNSGLMGNINIKKDNLLGRGQRVNLNMEVGSNNKKTFELGYYTPWTFGTKTSLDFNLYDKTETRQDEDEGEIEVDKFGGNLTLGHPITSNITGYAKLNIDQVKEEGKSEKNNRSLTTKVIRDTRNNILDPRTGDREEISVEKAGILNGDNDYLRYELDLRKYLPSGDENSWAFRVKYGGTTGELPRYERYTLSGLDGVRGYNSDYYSNKENDDEEIIYNAVEEGFIGESILVSNFEYRFKIIDKIMGVAFVDAGRTFEDELNIDDLKDINYSLGLGARFDTPIGQLGLDYGYAPEGELGSKTDFSIRIGNRF